MKENTVHLETTILVSQQCPVYSSCAPSHVQRGARFWPKRGHLCGRGDSLDFMHELLPCKSVLCLNQSALIKCIICHIFTYLLVTVYIKGITSANKKSFIIYVTKLSWFSLQFFKSSQLKMQLTLVWLMKLFLIVLHYLNCSKYSIF